MGVFSYNSFDVSLTAFPPRTVHLSKTTAMGIVLKASERIFTLNVFKLHPLQSKDKELLLEKF